MASARGAAGGGSAPCWHVRPAAAPAGPRAAERHWPAAAAAAPPATPPVAEVSQRNKNRSPRRTGCKLSCTAGAEPRCPIGARAVPGRPASDASRPLPPDMCRSRDLNSNGRRRVRESSFFSGRGRAPRGGGAHSWLSAGQPAAGAERRRRHHQMTAAAGDTGASFYHMAAAEPGRAYQCTLHRTGGRMEMQMVGPRRAAVSQTGPEMGAAGSALRRR